MAKTPDIDFYRDRADALFKETLQLRYERTKMQDENEAIRAELNNVSAKIAELMAERPAFDAQAECNKIIEKIEQLIQAFTMHMNANTSALNAMNALIANLKVGK